ncbi:MAG: hypothetical protein A4E50_02121 [Methanosaeta sp. PtaB.Bin087]|nr:MAG: hypothetical protein A4E50_02121 [Methanosaeta sp. PtaB.Bin087]
MNARIAVACLILAAIYSAPSGAEDAPLAAEIPRLEGVWTLDMEGDMLSMVVYQSGPEIAGACTGEYPEPWNAVMTGSVSGNEVNLFLLSLQDGVGIMTEISGGEMDGGIKGSFVQTNSLGGWRRGNLTGFMTNHDTSAYEPAPPTFRPLSSEPSTEPSKPLEAEDGGTEDKRGGSGGISPPGGSEAGERRFVDVTTQAERVFYLGWAWNPG